MVGMVEGRRGRGHPRTRWLDEIKKDWNVTWRTVSGCRAPKRMESNLLEGRQKSGLTWWHNTHTPVVCPVALQVLLQCDKLRGSNIYTHNIPKYQKTEL